MKRKKHAIINKEFLDAAKQGNLDDIEILIEEGADINTIDDDRFTSLHYATANGHVDVVKFLLEKGAAVDNEVLCSCAIPIHIAAFHGYLDVVKLFVEFGVDINTCEPNNCNTPLHEASKKGHLNVAQYLIENGANIYAMNNRGKKPIHSAAQNGHKNIIEFFLSQNISIDEPDENNWTPLHYAMDKSNLSLMRYLVDKGANIKCRTNNGISPLCLAAQHRPLTDNKKMHINKEILDFIIAKGGGINDANEVGLVPLHYAVMKTDAKKVYYIVEKLVDAGAKADMPAYVDGKTPLHYACHKNYVCVVKKMMEANPNLDIQDNEGNTPLHLASKQQYTKIMKCLLEAGARSDIKDNEGCTALFYYIFNFANYEITYNEGNPLFAQEILGKINNYTDIDNDQKRTAAHIAIEGNCDIEFLKLVLEKQKDVNIEDINGNTVLNKLIEEWFTTRNSFCNILSSDNCIEAIRLLIDKGAYLKMIDCQRIIADPSLSNTLFTDVKLCTQSIVNKYNNKNLPVLYGLPLSVPLPPIEKIMLNSSQIGMIEHAVETEIRNEQYCDVSKMMIPRLSMLSVEAYISHYL